ncbi:zinc-dependent metalloprotease [Duganella sp. sic0402]|nr:zinc-dependent metalloprotease [Duganella sp. sic0402]
MQRSVLFSLVLAGVLHASPALADTAPASASRSVAALTANLQAQPGFLHVWRDADKGRVLLTVKTLDSPFLLVTSLPYGLGSNDIGLDRGQPGEVRTVRFEKRGARLFLVEDNTGYVANSANADERNSAVQAFASAVLWSGDILASDAGGHLVDFSSFLLSDQHGVTRRLAGAKQGSYSINAARSAVLPELAKSFPDNTELEAELTFQGAGEGAAVRRVAADASALTLRQHISLVKLPEPGFAPRAYHPASGGNANPYVDFAAPLSASMEVRWQRRHRLQKTDPSAAVSTVKKPIVYYLDRGTPEPMRSALLDGARWWASAFEKAGFKDAYRVELLPEGVDPMDIRYNVIAWVHRDTRGWSYGSSLVDPRTGEIIKGAVTLDSQRMRQDALIAESLLAPYGKSGERTDAAKAAVVEKTVLARLRQLAAHEIGHTLGFAHNFASSRQGNGSVMDYPHPLLTIGADGAIALNEPYGNGVGPWDDFVVAHTYTEFATPQAEAEGLARLRADARARKLDYVSDADSRPSGASHPNGLMWDVGPDSLSGWDLTMTARKRALQQFSIGVLPDARQVGELEARLVPVYLLHRYQTEAVARLVAGASFEYATIGDVRSGARQAGVQIVPAAIQRQALHKLVDSLRAEQLVLPSNVLDILSPPSQGYQRTPEYFATSMERVFDPYAAAEAAAAQTSLYLFDPARFNRLSWQHARDAQQPGVADTLELVWNSGWKRAPAPSALIGGTAVQQAADWVVLESVLRLLDGDKLHPQVDADVRQSVRELAAWLVKSPASGSVANNRRRAAELITRYLADPRSVKLRAAPAIPPGAPI